MHQNAFPIPHTWREFIWLLIAGSLGIASRVLPSPFKRKQTKAETAKIEAEARAIDINATVAAGEAFVDLLKEVATITDKAERLRRQMEFWRARARAEKARADLAEKQLDEHIRIGDGDTTPGNTPPPMLTP